MPDSFVISPTPKWFSVSPSPTAKGRRTLCWRVTAHEGGLLGYVEWYNPWRCYAFFPQPDTVFEKDCLRDLATWLEAETNARRRARQKERDRMKQPGPGLP